MEGSHVDISPALAGRLKKLVDLTKPLDILKVLEVRRASMLDESLLKIIKPQQLDAVFDMIIQTKAMELPDDESAEVKRTGGKCLLPEAGKTYPPKSRADDEQVMLRCFGPGESKEEEEAHADFVEMFDDVILKHMLDLLDFFAIPDEVRGDYELPYVMAPAFRPVLEDVLRNRICPAMRNARSIMLLESSHMWGKTGNRPLLELLYGDDDRNAIFFAWDDRWAQLKPPPPQTAEEKKKAKAKEGLLSRLTGKKEKKFVPGATKMDPKRIKELRAFWKGLAEKAVENGYTPPRSTHIPLFQDMLRYNLRKIKHAWGELEDLYQQEFDPQKHQQEGREGSFRDGLNKWHNRLPNHAGEFLAIKAFYEFEDCDNVFMRKYAVTHGVKVEVRRKHAPILTAFVEQLPPPPPDPDEEE